MSSIYEFACEADHYSLPLPQGVTAMVSGEEKFAHTLILRDEDTGVVITMNLYAISSPEDAQIIIDQQTQDPDCVSDGDMVTIHRTPDLCISWLYKQDDGIMARLGAQYTLKDEAYAHELLNHMCDALELHRHPDTLALSRTPLHVTMNRRPQHHV